MEERHTVQNIIDDLKKFGKLEEPSGEIPEAAMRYLLLNYHPIKYCVESVYEKMSEAQREELCENHKELDYSIGRDKARNIVSQPLSSLRHYYYGLGGIAKDDLIILIKALKYAKYLNISFHFLFRNP